MVDVLDIIQIVQHLQHLLNLFDRLGIGDLIGGADGATGIVPTIRTIDRDGTENFFDLQGRRLNSKPNKGIYIENGKKYAK